jgi:hypothetical protein
MPAPSGMRQLGYQQLTSLSAAAALTVPAGTILAMCTPETQAVRWRDDGTSPTASVGYPLPVGAELRYDAGGLAALKFIEQVASAKLNVVYYGNQPF